MNWFKRLCLFVFGIAGLLSLAALCLTWVGPWTSQARSMLELQWYMIVLEVLVCISAVGLIVCVFLPLFYPRNPRESVVAEVEGGTITVTRAAIISQTRHIVEADGTCVASTVRVRMKKKGNIRINLRVTPHHPVDVVKRGELLYAQLGEGLSHVCGDSVKSIAIVFNEPEQQGPLTTYVETGETTHASPSAAERPQTSNEPITVPVTSLVPPPKYERPIEIADVEVAAGNSSENAVEEHPFAEEDSSGYGVPTMVIESADEAAETLELSGTTEEA